MSNFDLRRVEAVNDDGSISGVTVISRRGASHPATCPLEDAAILHPAEAYKLRRWARAHGIKARTRIFRKHAEFRSMTSLLKQFF